MENIKDRKRIMPISNLQQFKEYSVQIEQIDENKKNI